VGPEGEVEEIECGESSASTRLLTFTSPYFTHKIRIYQLKTFPPSQLATTTPQKSQSIQIYSLRRRQHGERGIPAREVQGVFRSDEEGHPVSPSSQFGNNSALEVNNMRL